VEGWLAKLDREGWLSRRGMGGYVGEGMVGYVGGGWVATLVKGWLAKLEGDRRLRW
jgi:hypothetical protein